MEPNGLKHVEHPLKMLKNLKLTWIVGHIKVLRILRETYKSACNSSHEQKQWFETFETPLPKKNFNLKNPSPRIVGHFKVLRRGREI